MRLNGKEAAMTNEQINIAIAESLGWTEISDWKAAGINGLHPSGQWTEVIPNYTADLNACHEAVNTLSGGKYVNWVFELEKICGMPVGYNASARQRCEAYLKTIGKWIE